MNTFSKRYGYEKIKEFQVQSLDNETRNLLWSMFWKICNTTPAVVQSLPGFAEYIWVDFLKNRIDEFPCYKTGTGLSLNTHPDYSFLKNIFVYYEWYKVYDLIEEFYRYFGYKSIKNKINEILEKENCAYRLVDSNIVEITAECEIKEIEKAAASNNDIAVKSHITKALSHLSDRENPDYRNSIKESISAVEALCRKFTGESTLDKSLKKLESKGLVLNPQLKAGLEKIYFYTNSEGGLRHSLLDESKVDQADAKFMLVSCSAFVNYIISKLA
jgi:hypothetical protein